ncbi:MAG: ribonuclease H family protein [Acetatifactor sp.]|nr:ribonuclease H family protein [Acetatifactor sp.]
MANSGKKNFYAVKNGIKPGIYKTWDECKKNVDGFAGALYKGFSTYEEALEFMGEDIVSSNACGAVSEEKTESPSERPKEGALLAYVDGSYDDSIKTYAFGCVFILSDGRIFTACGNGKNPDSISQRNVTGEMLGAMYATMTAIKNGFHELEIKYDYEGIEKWVNGAWKAKTANTSKYAEYMRAQASKINIRFTKVPAHSNVYYNEMADREAKRGLTEGDGIPEVILFDGR